MTNAALLCLALILDAIFGEPRAIWSRLPHPAVLMGRAVGRIDLRFNHGSHRRAKGAASFAALAAFPILAGVILAALPGGWIIEALLAAILLAQRSLVDHVAAVADALRLSTGDARRAVAQIVGRDTRGMDDPAIARAAIESAAENFSDGLTAPAFWFLIGGLPGLLLYKITNTADSMIGYKTQRHADFGWAAARFDDLLNWLPARLTALLFAALHGLLNQWSAIRADAGLHRSPNAGWPEAAMARALGVALAGPRSYDGQMQEYAFVNPNGNRAPGADQIDGAITILWRAWAAILGLSLLIAVV